jgi:peptidoglycan/LPS O-acetylase OafA/YrhL
VEGAVIVRDARFPLVDALRAIAALSIVGYHLAFLLGGFDLDVAGRWLARLNVGVPLFFAISGFLLYRPWVAARLAGEPPPSTRRYAVRRTLRILPAYWLALTAIALLAGRSDVFSWPGALVHFGLLQGYDADRFTGGIGQAWTLTIEVAFYALLPLLGLAMRRVAAGVRGEVAMLVALVACSLAFKGVVLGLVDGDAPAYLVLLAAFPAQLDMFAAGMALAVLGAAGRGARFGRAAGSAWLVGLAAFAMLGAWTPEADAARVLGEHALQTVVAVTLLAPAVLGERDGGAVRRLLAWRPLAWVGLISYGLYLWHLDAIRELVEAGLPALVVIVVGTAVSIALGAASWYGLERYALRRGHPRRREPRPSEPMPATPGSRAG